MRGKSTVPKDALVDIIIHNLTEEFIRRGLNIGAEGNLESRIYNLNKSDLVDLLKSSEEGSQLLADLEDKYPLSEAPTLFLVISRNLSTIEDILERTNQVAGNAECILSFPSGKTIRRVYSTERARISHLSHDIIEIPVYYERRLDYISADSSTWGEAFTVYDLRRAFIWITPEHNHGLVACSDYAGIKPILTWVNKFLNVRLNRPNITIDLFHRLAEGGTPRTATFTVAENAEEPFIDVQSLTVFDQELENSNAFRQLSSNGDDWEQTAGYFSRHPVVSIGGLGITRRYGRIWTPNHLPKDQLLNSAIDLISRTEEKLIEKLETNDRSFIDHFKDIPVQINGKVITKESRAIFDEIAFLIYRLRSLDRNQAQVADNLINRIIEHKETLGFTTILTSECDQCGPVLVKCPICSTPYEVVFRDGEIRVLCPFHMDLIPNGYEEYICDCGQAIEVILPNSIKIFPGLSTIKAFRDYISRNASIFSDWFVIDGGLIRIHANPRIRSREYSLNDLDKWRRRAHIHVREIIPDRRMKLIKRILRNIKEKCSQNNWHPDRQMCTRCLIQEIRIDNINESNMCLPRLMGLAIEESFDGIHQRFEQADIRYNDSLSDEGNRDIHIGIHLKSRENRPPKRGVGQGSVGIKGLYAQYFYTVHRRLTGGGIFDLIGISIPNMIFQEIKDAFVGISIELGVPIIVLDEQDWVLIVDAAIEYIENQ